jgi:DNA-binding response OmpR family regulator
LPGEALPATLARNDPGRLQPMTKKKILLVQDDFLLAEGLRIVIEGGGYEVAGLARDTASADRLATQHRPALAIVDLMLEIDVDGIATASFLKQKHSLEILITTGFPDAVVEREGVQDFACAIVKKPYTDQEILDAVARCLAADPAAQQS